MSSPAKAVAQIELLILISARPRLPRNGYDGEKRPIGCASGGHRSPDEALGLHRLAPSTARSSARGAGVGGRSPSRRCAGEVGPPYAFAAARRAGGGFTFKGTSSLNRV